MKKQKILGIVLLILTVGLSVASFILLPERVVVQFSVGGHSANTLPKIIAVLIPMLLGAFGGIGELIQKDDASDSKSKNSPVILGVVGVGVLILTLVVNLVG